MRKTTWNLKPNGKLPSLAHTTDTIYIQFAHKHNKTTLVFPNQHLHSSDSSKKIVLPTTAHVFVDDKPYLCPRPMWCNDVTLMRTMQHDNMLRRCTLKTPSQPDICLNLHLLHVLYEHASQDELVRQAALHNRPHATFGEELTNSANKCGCLILTASPPRMCSQDGSWALVIAKTPDRVNAYSRWLLNPSTEHTLLQRVDVRHMTDHHKGKLPRDWMRDRMTCEIASNEPTHHASVCGAFLSNGTTLSRQSFLQTRFEEKDPTGADLYVMYLNKDRRYVVWNPKNNAEWTHPRAVNHMLAHYIDHQQHERRAELEARLRHEIRKMSHKEDDASTQPECCMRELCMATAAENNDNQMRHDWLMCSIHAEQLFDVTLTPEEYEERARSCDESHKHQQELLRHSESIKQHADLKHAIMDCLTQNKLLSAAHVNDALTAHVMSEDGEWVSFAPTTLLFEGECPDDMTVRLCKKQTIGDVQPKPLFVPIPAGVFTQCIDRDHTETHGDDDDWDTLTEYEIICKTMTMARMDTPKAETKQEIDLLSESASFGLPFAEVHADDEILSLVVETDTDPKWAPNI